MPHIDDRFRFARTRLAADARSAARARAEFSSWLNQHFSLDQERFNDILLAVNEAIANAAEFAYVDAPRPGTLDVTATYEPGTDALVVHVDDHGRWRDKVPQPAGALHQLRGRGIPLMRTLADEVTIDRTPGGTHVRLTWSGLTRGR